jgi:putative ABC transport system substrate-binding protein
MRIELVFCFQVSLYRARISGTHSAGDAFRSALAELGGLERSITLIFRAPPQEGDPIESLAAKLVRSNVDLIVAIGDRAIQAARHATNTIPIVMCPASDAVEQGFITSLEHPGGNITGISILNTELAPKRLEILREIVPKASRVAVLMWSGTAELSFRAAQTAAQSIGVELLSLEVSEYADLERAFQTVAKGRADGLLVLGGPPFFGLRKRITELALKHKIPALYNLPSFAREGGLLVYGPSDTEYYRCAAWWTKYSRVPSPMIFQRALAFAQDRHRLSVDDVDVLALDVAKFLQALRQGTHEACRSCRRPRRRAGASPRPQKAMPRPRYSGE